MSGKHIWNEGGWDIWKDSFQGSGGFADKSLVQELRPPVHKAEIVSIVESQQNILLTLRLMIGGRHFPYARSYLPIEEVEVVVGYWESHSTFRDDILSLLFFCSATAFVISEGSQTGNKPNLPIVVDVLCFGFQPGVTIERHTHVLQPCISRLCKPDTLSWPKTGGARHSL